MDTTTSAMPWLVVRIHGQSFALPTGSTRELVNQPEITAVPGTPNYVRGVMNLRGRVLPVIDLRVRLGLASAGQEVQAFIDLMGQRRQDHINWLNELEASARERRPFKLATDPHKCAFGRWYDAYKPENPWIGNLLRRFNEPHCQIHATAVEALALQAGDDWDGASNLIASARTGVLARLLGLFDTLQELIRDTRREIAVVVESDRGAFSLAVDEAMSVETFEPANLGPLPVTSGNGLVAWYGQRGNGEPPLLMLAVEHLLPRPIAIRAA